VNLVSLAVRNVGRNRFRTSLTLVGVAVAVVAFVLLRTVISSMAVAVTHAAHDRIGIRHKVSFVMQLPRRYVDTVRQTPGVHTATWANWFGGKDPRNPREFFPTMAVDPPSFLDVYDEIAVSPADRARWFGDRQGALVGDQLARLLHLRVGDTVTLAGTIYPGNWVFHVSGIYTATRRSMDRSEFLFHWDYLNNALPERRRDQIGWIIARVDNPSQASSVSAAVDRTFDVQDIQTLSMSERSMNLSFMGMMSGLLTAINAISGIILLILLMLFGNTMSMGVRERTQEYGVLRALGFLPKHIAGFILGEAAALGLAAGALGLALSYPFVQYGLGRWLEENMGSMVPYFRIEVATAAQALGFSLLLGVAAAVIPAVRASRLTVTDALRRID
jgi:putative ABC transport system permease protein